MQQMIWEKAVPVWIAEHAIKGHQHRRLLIIAPGKFSVLASDLEQFSSVDGGSELPHESTV